MPTEDGFYLAYRERLTKGPKPEPVQVYVSRDLVFRCGVQRSYHIKEWTFVRRIET